MNLERYTYMQVLSHTQILIVKGRCLFVKVKEPLQPLCSLGEL